MSNEVKGRDHNQGMIYGLLSRAPGGILGGLGLVSLLSGAIELHSGIQKIVTGYQSVTQPVWSFLLGWLFEWLNWRFDSWMKDYLTMGVIVGAAAWRSDLVETRAEKHEPTSLAARIGLFLSCIVLWPSWMLLYLGFYASNSDAMVEEALQERKNAHLDRVKSAAEVANKAEHKIAGLLYLAATQAENPKKDDLVSNVRNFKAQTRAFFEFILWAFIIIAISYGLIFAKA